MIVLFKTDNRFLFPFFTIIAFPFPSTTVEPQLLQARGVGERTASTTNVFFLLKGLVRDLCNHQIFLCYSQHFFDRIIHIAYRPLSCLFCGDLIILENDMFFNT